MYFTSYRYHATKLAQEITSRKERLTLVAVGGDGTVNEILNGIRDFSLVTFAYIPPVPATTLRGLWACHQIPLPLSGTFCTLPISAGSIWGRCL